LHRNVQDVQFAEDTAKYFAMLNLEKASWSYPRSYVEEVLTRALELHLVLPSLVNIAVPPVNGGRVNICGDTHGQFFDLLNIFSEGVAGPPRAGDSVFVFNGDMVDRGVYSFEVAFVLLALKVASPDAVHLLRGNHECASMNERGGFAKQVREKYDQEILNLFRKVFQALPVCAVVGREPGYGGLFVTHGGIGPKTSEMTLEDLQRLERFHEPFEERTSRGSPETNQGLCTVALSELLWCDPFDSMDEEEEANKGGKGRGGDFRRNSPRGLPWGYSWGPNASARFLDRNGLQLLVRSHQCCQRGVQFDHDGRCITVFSAPNYVDVGGNLGAILRLRREEKREDGEGEGEGALSLEVVSFEAVPHPRYKPSL
jgi:serine/threonine-protein phosphatase 5